MALFKAYVGPSDGAFELVMAITGTNQEQNIIADIFIAPRNSDEEIVTIRRSSLVYSADDSLITGGILKINISSEVAALITPHAGYNDGTNFFLYGEQVRLRDYTNSNPVSSTDTDTTSTIVVPAGAYDVFATDATGLIDNVEERIIIENGIGVTIDTSPQWVQDQAQDIELTYAFVTAPAEITTSLTFNGDVIDISGLDFSSGTASFSHTPNEDGTYIFTVNDVEDELIISAANEGPTVTIAQAPAGTLALGGTAQYTATVTPTEEQSGGTYIWFVDGFRQLTTTHPTNTFELTQTIATSHVVTCAFFDALGLGGTSNEITTTWA